MHHSVRTLTTESVRQQVTTVTFTILLEYSNITDIERTRAVPVVKKCDVVTRVSTMTYKCYFIMSETSGLPCVHVITVVITYRT